jgi:predicted metal-dependent hydrolase
VPPETFWLGLKQFNQRQFYDCHDTLEAIWIEASEYDKNFYQGILQIAVACYHLSNLNQRGAMILLGEGIKRLNEYQPLHYNVDVTQLVAESYTLLVQLQQLASDQLPEFTTELFADKSSLLKHGVKFKIKLPKITQKVSS